MIVPAARFNCNGRITSIAASLQFLFGTDLPLFQVWRPFSPNSTIYTKISEVELPPGDRMGGIIVNYYFANLSLNSSSQIEFQSGDVIGYFQSPDPQRWVRNIQATGYTSYSNDASNSSASFIDTSNTDNTDIERQPLIEVAIGQSKMYIHSHCIFTQYPCIYTYLCNCSFSDIFLVSAD